MSNYSKNFRSVIEIDVSRSFFILYASITVMLIYAGFDIITESSYSLLCFYIALIIIPLYLLKAHRLLKDFKNILYTSNSMSEFKTLYAEYVDRKDYLKFRLFVFFLFGWASTDFVRFFIHLFN
jgi:hypothetical protein